MFKGLTPDIAAGVMLAEMIGDTSINELRDEYFDEVGEDGLVENQKKLRAVLDGMPIKQAIASLGFTTMYYLLAEALSVDPNTQPFKLRAVSDPVADTADQSE